MVYLRSCSQINPHSLHKGHPVSPIPVLYQFEISSCDFTSLIMIWNPSLSVLFTTIIEKGNPLGSSTHLSAAACAYSALFFRSTTADPKLISALADSLPRLIFSRCASLKQRQFSSHTIPRWCRRNSRAISAVIVPWRSPYPKYEMQISSPFFISTNTKSTRVYLRTVLLKHNHNIMIHFSTKHTFILESRK